MKLPIPFSKHLAQIRKAAGLTQAQLAGRANLHKSRVGAFECGRRNPSSAELTPMASAMNVTTDLLTAGTDWTHEAAPQLDLHASRSLQVPPYPLIVSQLPFQKHLDSAFKLNPKAFRHFQSMIEKRPTALALQCFLRDTWADSGVEAMWWLNLCSEQTRPVRLPLLAHGLREHQAVCPTSGLPVGDVPRAGLWLPGETPAVFFPQITIATPRRPIRVDCLTCFGQNRWVIIEVDGDGHDARWDELRTGQVVYPVWRFNTSEVQKPDLISRILAKLSSRRPGEMTGHP